MSLMEYDAPRPQFDYRGGWTASITIPDCEAYVTAYVPDPRTPLYRASITGDQLIMEFVEEAEEKLTDGDRGRIAEKALERVVNDFGLVDLISFIPPIIAQSRYATMGELRGDRKSVV